MMKKFIFFLFIMLSVYAYAQNYPNRQGNRQMPQGMFDNLEPNKGAVMGKVTNSDGAGIEYTTVTLYKSADSSIVDGTLTDTAGRFVLMNVPYGNYYLEVKFVGFKKKIITNIDVSSKERFVRIGRILLEEQAQELDEVVVTAQAHDVEYRVDKKVINVSQNLTASSGTAVDVLQNVPSVEVDIQGNVTLRGSSNFTVFINGKPSVLDGSEALQQIPASDIEKIEIITNPSAKYDPDGVAGIINIITKQNRDKGFNGNITVSYDNYNSLRINSIFNVRYKKFNFFVGLNKNERVRPSDVNITRILTYDSLTSVFNTTGYNIFRRGGWTAQSGFNYYINDKNTLTVTGKVGQRTFLMNSLSNIEQYATLNENTLYQYYYTQLGFTISEGWIYQADVDLQHKFDNSGHQIHAYAYISSWSPLRTNATKVDTTDAQWNKISEITYQQQSLENRTGLKARMQVDYELPLSGNRKIEAGYSGRYVEMGSDYSFYETDAQGELVSLPDFDNYLILKRNIQAGYLTYTGKLSNIFDYQLGLRTEYIDRQIEQMATNEVYNLKRVDWFPSAHISKRFANNFQLQLGYSRRVNRPNGWNLNPFPMYVDQYTIMQGNPSLLPEYANAYEFNLIKNFKSGYVAFESFYRQTLNKFERIQTVGDANTIIYTWTNAGEDRALGGELSLNLSLMRMFMINASTSVYHYRLIGTLDEVDVNTATFTWNSRLMLMAMFPTMTKLQVTAYYRAPSVTLQGYREGMLFNSISLRQDFFKRKLAATFTISDPFKLSKYSFVTDVENLYTSTEYIMQSPQISLTLSLRINNYKPQRQGRQTDDVSEFEGEGLY